MATAIAPVGHNAPPPIETHKLNIEELFAEAQNFLDGEPITSQDQADSVGRLLSMLREARKAADEQRAIEKKPHDDAGKAVQAAWKPLIERTELAERTAKQALAPWLEAVDAEKRAAADAAKREAEEKAAAARAAIQAADPIDLAAREQAEALLKDAGKAERAATRADKDRAQVAGGARAVSLRDVFTPELANPVEALKHYRTMQPEALKQWLLDQARTDVRAGKRSIPGFTIHHERVAV